MLQLFRLIKIITIILRFRLDNLIALELMPWWLRWPLSLGPWRVLRCNKPRAERLRLVLELLGPVFIKFGQLLSTRPDFVPEDLVAELSKLQDQVPPFSPKEATRRIESTLKKPVGELFSSFDMEPLASASVAQVHTALLHTGESVVVKVIRPGIERVIRHDMSLLKVLAKILMKVSIDIRRLRLIEIVSDYEKTLLDELDLQREAANASQLRRNFLNSPDIYIPEVYWDFCRDDIMVMERVHGISVDNITHLEAIGTDFKKLAERAVTVFFTQVFRDGFFHADMHPGNILVNAENPKDPYFIAIDFGIVGSLTPDDQSYLARNVLAFFYQDYRKVAELHIRSGWVPHSTPVHELEAAIRTVCEPIFDRPLADISFGQVLLGLFQTARRFNMEVQPQLVLLEKTLLNVEGIGRQLYPQLNLWVTAQPFLEDWLKKRVSPIGLAQRLHQQVPDWIEQAPMLARQIMEKLDREPTSEKRRPFPPLVRILGGVILASTGILLYQPSWLGDFPLLIVALGVCGTALLLGRL